AKAAGGELPKGARGGRGNGKAGDEAPRGGALPPRRRRGQADRGQGRARSQDARRRFEGSGTIVLPPRRGGRSRKARPGGKTSDSGTPHPAPSLREEPPSPDGEGKAPEPKPISDPDRVPGTA